jgi:hypothetical protein
MPALGGRAELQPVRIRQARLFGPAAYDYGMSRAVASLLLLICGCATVTSPTVPLGRPFVLAPGEAVRIAATDSRLRFVAVENDSRCPGDALCIHQGDAIVRIVLEEPGDAPHAYLLHTAGTTQVSHENLTISIVDLQPYPFSSHPIAAEDYRATLRVTR